MNDEAKQKLIRIIGTIVVLVIIIGGVYFLVKKDAQNRNNSSPSPSTEQSAALTIKDDDWLKGKKGAKAEIIEYSDFQCPACAYASSSLDEVYQVYPNEAAIVYRHFPLPNHQFAFDAAVASEIAGESGKFWEMHDTIFVNQEKISRDEILNIAQSLGFNRIDFDQKMNDKKYKDAVYKDQIEGEDLKLDHTPTIYINGIEYSGNLDKDSIINEIKKYL
ncbi:MAG: DSBA oxidoreductase [Candidatus Berkelbacteria bacterium Licking1014_96]|uniref:DSBA oxidoreductase n=1 Tax=Candidatus Berkelbacteria bacterium Licking1014_96 TaxID=2017149 RepID=A0A554LEF1_9BACT|nr:MAG: DSBA oxidoreductase [Candidatus Berkelbacteria bacterium Licking1014_96]